MRDGSARRYQIQDFPPELSRVPLRHIVLRESLDE